MAIRQSIEAYERFGDWTPTISFPAPTLAGSTIGCVAACHEGNRWSGGCRFEGTDLTLVATADATTPRNCAAYYLEGAGVGQNVTLRGSYDSPSGSTTSVFKVVLVYELTNETYDSSSILEGIAQGGGGEIYHSEAPGYTLGGPGTIMDALGSDNLLDGLLTEPDWHDYTFTQATGQAFVGGGSDTSFTNERILTTWTRSRVYNSLSMLFKEGGAPQPPPSNDFLLLPF